jgi:outer membrane protein OmpA-like peptidoglycan-associated protein
VKQQYLLTGFLLLAPVPALAQVTVNPAALQQLAGIEPPPPMAAVVPVAAPVHHWAHAARAPAPRAEAPVQQAAAHVMAPLKPPVAAVAVAAKPPAPPSPPQPGAPVSLVFAPGSADLPANAAAALKPYCTASGHVAISAHAPADPSDPSAAMRLSLARALAVQQVLAYCGVPPTNILPRALGDVPGQNEDETVIGSGTAK